MPGLQSRSRQCHYKLLLQALRLRTHLGCFESSLSRTCGCTSIMHCCSHLGLRTGASHSRRSWNRTGWELFVRRAEPGLVPLISKGTVDIRGLRAVGSDAADYVAPSDRYAVVPQASGQNGSVAVPQVCCALVPLRRLCPDPSNPFPFVVYAITLSHSSRRTCCRLVARPVCAATSNLAAPSPLIACACYLSDQDARVSLCLPPYTQSRYQSRGQLCVGQDVQSNILSPKSDLSSCRRQNRSGKRLRAERRIRVLNANAHAAMVVAVSGCIIQLAISLCPQSVVMIS